MTHRIRVMTRRAAAEYYLRLLTIICPACHAEVGEACRISADDIASGVEHGVRPRDPAVPAYHKSRAEWATDGPDLMYDMVAASKLAEE